MALALKIDPAQYPIVSNPQRVRNNCQTAMWMANEGQTRLDTDMYGIVFGSYDYIGNVPPINSFKQLTDQLKQANQTVPDEGDINSIVEALERFSNDWISLFFIPIIPCDSPIAKVVKQKRFAVRCVTQSFIKSGSLWGTSPSGSGFWEYQRQLEQQTTSIASVITKMTYDNTHKNPSGGDCKGVQFSTVLDPSKLGEIVGRNGEIEDLDKLFQDAQQFIEELASNSRKEKAVTALPLGFDEQLFFLDPSQTLETLPSQARKQIVARIVSNQLTKVKNLSLPAEEILPMLSGFVADESQRMSALEESSPFVALGAATDSDIASNGQAKQLSPVSLPTELTSTTPEVNSDPSKGYSAIDLSVDPAATTIESPATPASKKSGASVKP